MARKNRKAYEDMTDQEKRIYDSLKAKKDRKKAEKKERLQEVVRFAIEKGPADLVIKAKTFLPRSAGGTAGLPFARKNLTKDLLLGLFPMGVGTSVTEDEVWAQFKLGRAEMRKKTIMAIKKAAPEDRVWVSFEPASGTYILQSIGPDAPDGWLGYVPLEKERDMEDPDPNLANA